MKSKILIVLCTLHWFSSVQCQLVVPFRSLFAGSHNTFTKKKAARKKQHNYDNNRFMAEANFFVFHPTGCVLKKTFGKNWLNYQLKCLMMINPDDSFWKDVYVWFGINYLARNGCVIGGGDKTRIEMTPLSAGLRYDYCAIADWLYLNVDLGLHYYFVRIRNQSQLVDNVSRSTPGGIVQLGSSFVPYERMSINLFLNYTFGHLERSVDKCCDSVRPTSLRLSGINFGGGLGFHF